MLRMIQRISLLLAGYSILGLGLLGLGITVNFMWNVFPEILIAQILGLLITLGGIWVLGKYDKIFETKQPWRR